MVIRVHGIYVYNQTASDLAKVQGVVYFDTAIKKAVFISYVTTRYLLLVNSQNTKEHGLSRQAISLCSI